MAPNDGNADKTLTPQISSLWTPRTRVKAANFSLDRRQIIAFARNISRGILNRCSCLMRWRALNNCSSESHFRYWCARPLSGASWWRQYAAWITRRWWWACALRTQLTTSCIASALHNCPYYHGLGEMMSHYLIRHTLSSTPVANGVSRMCWIEWSPVRFELCRKWLTVGPDENELRSHRLLDESGEHIAQALGLARLRVGGQPDMIGDYFPREYPSRWIKRPINTASKCGGQPSKCFSRWIYTGSSQ